MNYPVETIETTAKDMGELSKREKLLFHLKRNKGKAAAGALTLAGLSLALQKNKNKKSKTKTASVENFELAKIACEEFLAKHASAAKHTAKQIASSIKSGQKAAARFHNKRVGMGPYERKLMHFLDAQDNEQAIKNIVGKNGRIFTEA